MSIKLKLSYTQKLICNLINDYDKIQNRNILQYAKRKNQKSKPNYEIINYSQKTGGGKKNKKKKTKEGLERKQGEKLKKEAIKNELYTLLLYNGWLSYCSLFNPQWKSN